MLNTSRSAGFTFPEALVTIGLLLLFSVTAGGLFFTARGAAERQHREGQVLQTKAALATLLPSLCQEVRPPEWARPEAVFENTGARWTAHFFEGSPEKILTVEVVGSDLVVTTPVWQGRWSGLDQLRAGWWTESSRIVGIQFTWTEAGDGRTLHLPWGSRPL